MARGMQIVSICQEMGWDYTTYQQQPIWFIDLLKDKLRIDSDNMKKQINKTKQR